MAEGSAENGNIVAELGRSACRAFVARANRKRLRLDRVCIVMNTKSIGKGHADDQERLNEVIHKKMARSKKETRELKGILGRNDQYVLVS